MTPGRNNQDVSRSGRAREIVERGSIPVLNFEDRHMSTVTIAAIAGSRRLRQIKTRERLFEAAVAQFGVAGMAAADLGEIAAAAGVARATFYFHFPNKEHILLALADREEAAIAQSLRSSVSAPRDLATSLARTIDLVLALESRFGTALFRDLMSERFMSDRRSQRWPQCPVVAAVAAIIESSAAQRKIPAHQSAMFFVDGLYGLLAVTGEARQLRHAVLDSYLLTTVRSLEAR
ncbi:TetR/AcrR family transcriptional regulator [Nocardia alba]|nr:TetR/AcrR family transcriptional regulator [Nocardia alba]